MADEAAPLYPAPASPRTALVRQRLIEVMARRASALEGRARERLEGRMAALRLPIESACVNEPGAAALAGGAMPAPQQQQQQPQRSQLAELLLHIQRQKERGAGAALGQHAGALGPQAAGKKAAAGPAAISSAPAEPQELQFFRRTWARLSVDRQLAQSRQALPQNAGPLNSHHIVHRTLSLMQQISPAYLEHFVGYVDSLLWLDQFNEQQFAQDPPARARPSPSKKAGPATKPRA
nr:DUF2894 domain-containing protein [uncultured Roseateles sp.]